MSETAAEKYADSLMDIAEQHGLEQQIGEQIDAVGQIFEESQPVRQGLTNPTIELDERRQIVETLVERLDLHKYLRNFMFILLDHHRANLINDVADAYRRELEKRQGKIRTHIKTAMPLSDSQRNQLRDTLSKMTGKDAILETEVDESLLGGVVARVGGIVYDGSVATRLHELRGNILQHV